MKTPIVYSILLLIGAFSLLSATQKSDVYVVGDEAADFALLNVDGRYVSMNDYRDVKGFIVVFTSNQCPYSQLYEQRIIALHNKYNPKGFPVIAINPNDPTLVPDESYEEMVLRARENKYPFVYLFDPTQKVYQSFGAQKTPHAFVLDKKKVVQYIGAIDDNAENPSAVKNKYVENAVNALLRGEYPDPDYTRAIGCSIKRRR